MRQMRYCGDPRSYLCCSETGVVEIGAPAHERETPSICLGAGNYGSDVVQDCEVRFRLHCT